MAQRVNHQPIFILSATPWRESSLRVEAFSRDYGRVSLLARSARTRGSELRGMIVPFVPISASWFGKEELKTLHRAEWLGGWAQPKNIQLFSALYVNELLEKLLPPEEPLPEIFHYLSDTMREICTRPSLPSEILRLFEWRLLTALGYAPDWKLDAAGQPILSDAYYLIRPEHAAQAIVQTAKIPVNAVGVSGEILQQLGAVSLNAQSDLAAALRVTRLLLDFHVQNSIHTRRILQQLNELKNTLSGSLNASA